MTSWWATPSTSWCTASAFDAPVAAPEGAVRLGDFFAKMRAQAEAAGRRISAARGFGGDRHGSGLSEAPPLVDQPGWSVQTEFRGGDENEDQVHTASSSAG